MGRRRLYYAFGTTAWLAAVLLGWRLLWGYDLTPGAVGAIPHTWPAAARIARDASKPTLLVFIHPRCTCSRATLAELERLLQRIGAQADTALVVVQPEGQGAEGAEADLIPVVRPIAGTRMLADPGGRDARLFGATTSGHVLLYSSAGDLLFSGGITAARGHHGASPGQEEILAAITKSTPSQPARADTFGCALATSENTAR